MDDNSPAPVALVTGSDSGIGRATAVALAEAGHDVVITFHSDEEGARGTAEEVRSHGRRAEVHELDLQELPGAADIVDDVLGQFGRVDVLVNNAGRGASSPFVDHDYEDWRDVMAVNLDGPFLLGQRVARDMIDRGDGGVIINVTSVHEHLPLGTSSAYSASKGGLGLLTKVMAIELAEHGIRVNAVAPGEISTPMTDQHDVDPATEDRPGIPLGRPGAAEEIAAVVAFLASPGGAYVTGESLVVDGGLSLMGPERNRRDTSS